ncbi:succinate dehydrogenase, cytochrome b556 subunit [candidate division LCP-89 bacterium B3_LCP]|uniref:Succinate dehydrogenase cytochrome b556 subunit n=1 Tax=candidate division LCP-89 bacterium B3_LCP TaxID=2012998 RepID=A0A532UTU0_UNCL8|nr:MAG: succinate dehydrogenase, cytochrome b556 subunit [candidate division LCP-89 bacterium B3_LCP]
MHYKWKTGMWAFVMHRVTGLALTVYLIMHINVVSSLHDPGSFNKTMAFLGQPLFRVLELGLLAAVIYHGLNGVRVFLIDFCNRTKNHAAIFWILAATGSVIFIVGAYPLLHHAGIF